ncbi:hypothetical protein [Micromonospora sp. NPDC005173]|uniref:hypothetical protein n=1 Tax=Micromonospora sp. NPDC005173 TaxID=3157165 RepID=UPI0033B57958
MFGSETVERHAFESYMYLHRTVRCRSSEIGCPHSDSLMGVNLASGRPRRPHIKRPRSGRIDRASRGMTVRSPVRKLLSWQLKRLRAARLYSRRIACCSDLGG